MKVHGKNHYWQQSVDWRWDEWWESGWNNNWIKGDAMEEEDSLNCLECFTNRLHFLFFWQAKMADLKDEGE